MKRLATVVVAVFAVMVLFAVDADARRTRDSSRGGRPLVANLTGDAEVPGPGDPDGSGTALVTLNQGQELVCFEISTADVEDPTAAHIHSGVAGEAGPIVVDFGEPNEDGTFTGCVSAERTLIKTIRRTPHEFYVNVHNEEFPAGAVRGQLSKRATGRTR